ncbi:NIPSNAP family protein [Acidisphaera sp. L21]|uniref:NIPSNAP family protein n=1 Tax=Acidisphaera sp. L21 TaxID=1641851 RepID=UPI00131BB81F|nr:NIPSNAP family protein [Acidisphaera sp. L21]
MSEFYELATLALPLLSVAEGAKAAQDWVSAPRAVGTLLGCWRTEIGPLGRILILRGFDDADALQQERRRALLSANPFNAGQLVTALEMDSYVRFPFLPPAQPGARGPVYEVRTYKLKPGGLAPTLAGWDAAIAPAGDYTAHLVINMYALDGPPRITHIWGFDSLAQRASLRSAAYSAGVWPPKDGPENILEATSTIALPQSGSPLR